MPRNKYKPMTKREIIKLFRKGVYRVDLDTGEVFNGRGRKIKARRSHSALRHWRVDLYDGETGKFATPFLHQVVWMFGTMHPIPKGWEVHHRDEDVDNNTFNNLICLHTLDHLKFHYTEELDDVPF